MKRIVIFCCFYASTFAAFSQFVPPGQEEKQASKDSFYGLTPVEVRAIRASENSPFTKTNISKKEIAKTTNMTKNKRFSHTLVEMLLNISGLMALLAT